MALSRGGPWPGGETRSGVFSSSSGDRSRPPSGRAVTARDRSAFWLGGCVGAVLGIPLDCRRMSTSALVIRPLSLAEFRERCGDQLQEHWSEVPTARVMGLRPDWDRYAVLDDADQLLILGAFDGAEIIGYASVVLQPHLHDRETPVGLSDMIYVAPAWRKGTGLGMQMVAEVERHARDAGAKLMIWFARGTLDVILRASDYEIADTIYSKEL